MTNPVSVPSNGYNGYYMALPPGSNAVRLPGTPTTQVPPGTPTNPTVPTPPIPGQPPAWGQPFPSINVMPIEYLADYPGAPERLRMFGISNSDKLLSWGRTPSGRWALSHMIAVMANNQQRQYIDNKIAQWVGQADLLRVGADHSTAVLMQMTGIYDASYLRIYANSIDQFQLYSALQMKRLETGMPLIPFPKLQEIIRNAMMSPPHVYWYNTMGRGMGAGLGWGR